MYYNYNNAQHSLLRDEITKNERIHYNALQRLTESTETTLLPSNSDVTIVGDGLHANFSEKQKS